MKKRTLIGILTCSIFLSGCGIMDLAQEYGLGDLLSLLRGQEDEDSFDEEDEDLNEEEDEEQEEEIDYSTVIPMSVSNPEKYSKLMDEFQTLTDKLTTLDYQSEEYRKTKWAADDIKLELYGDIAGKLIGSDVSIDDFGGSLMEYYYASNRKFADEVVRGEEFSDNLKEGDTIDVFGELTFRVDKVVKDDKVDPDRVTGYQLSYVNSYTKTVDTNLADIFGKYSAAGCDYNGERYEVVWHEGRDDVSTNFDSLTEGAYTIKSANTPELGSNVPTIYRRISVVDYVELYNLQAGENWYFGDWNVKKKNGLYKIDESEGLFELEEITRGHCTIMRDGEDRFLDHAVLDISWLDREGNAVTYVYHLDAGWNAYKTGTYPQSIKFSYAG